MEKAVDWLNVLLKVQPAHTRDKNIFHIRLLMTSIERDAQNDSIRLESSELLSTPRLGEMIY